MIKGRKIGKMLDTIGSQGLCSLFFDLNPLKCIILYYKIISKLDNMIEDLQNTMLAAHICCFQMPHRMPCLLHSPFSLLYLGNKCVLWIEIEILISSDSSRSHPNVSKPACLTSPRMPVLTALGFSEHFVLSSVFTGGSVVKNLPAKQETRVRSLGQEDFLEKEMATHPSILAQKIPWTEEPGRLQSMELQKNWTQLSNQTQQSIEFLPK